MNFRSSLFLCAALALGSVTTPAQAQIRVAPRFNAELAITPRFTLEFGDRWVYGARIEESGREQIYVGAQLDALRWLRFGASYRIGAELYRRAVWSSHRIATDVTLAGRWRGFRLSYRLLWRNRWRPSSRVMTYDSTIRNRVALRYHLPKPVFLSVSGELFSVMLPSISGADSFRFEAEITGRVKPVDVAFGYRYQLPLLGTSQPYHMVMATVTWHWDRARAQRTPEERAQRRRERNNRNNGRGRDRPASQQEPSREGRSDDSSAEDER